MTLVYSFLFCGILCLIAQLILDRTTLTPGHLTSIYVVLGAILGCFNIYEKFGEVVGAGASVPIMSFGNILLKSSFEGYLENGFLGLFGNMFMGAGAGITATILFAFILTLFTKVKD